MTTRLCEDRDGNEVEITVMRADIITHWNGHEIHQWVDWCDPEECQAKNVSEPDPRWYLIDSNGFVKEASDIRLCVPELQMDVLDYIQALQEMRFDWQPGSTTEIEI